MDVLESCDWGRVKFKIMGGWRDWPGVFEDEGNGEKLKEKGVW